MHRFWIWTCVWFWKRHYCCRYLYRYRSVYRRTRGYTSNLCKVLNCFYWRMFPKRSQSQWWEGEHPANEEKAISCNDTTAVFLQRRTETWKSRHSGEKYCRILLKFIRRHHCQNEAGLGNDLTPNKLLAGTLMVQLTCAYIFYQSWMS